MDIPRIYEKTLPFLREIFILKNFFDVLIVTLLIYLFLFLLKKTKTAPLITGIFLLTIVYGLSVYFQLKATQKIFQLFFGTLLIIFAIVFQKELRRFFEFIGVLGAKRKIFPPSDFAVKTIFRAVRYLSLNKTGAIIVLAGKENLDRYIEGGFTLNGKISEALMLSIFDASSLGHDGAVIIDGDKVKKFGAHLPLSENIETAKKYGTRHRAAIGLSEISDAMIIVVSGEKGTISVARNKTISKMANEQELEKAIKDFIAKKLPFKKFSTYAGWLKENIFLIIVSFVISAVLWMIFIIQGSSISQRKFVVPINFQNIPAGYLVESEIQEAIITVSGKENDLGSFESKNTFLSLDMSSVKPGKRTLLLEKEDISKISDIFLIVQVSPDSIRIDLKKQPSPALQLTPSAQPTSQ